MLGQNDLQQIKEIVQDSEKRVTSNIISAVGEMVEQQILPRLDQLEQELGRLSREVDILRRDITHLDSQMVTKEYLDKKLADEFSDFYMRLKREWWSRDVQWKQRVITILQNAKIASGEDLQELKSLIGT
ncbi:MAG: hypothetical protein A3H42_06165 [Deltaproteobacteria bacterium RIFCSPLOWO2_02_FULL_46_8]|nr:MAG: hypothetical protein A3H42_06165 [Deltaproteobacteria bacterium RIFCSPLOWO2_02_FULL_46_8]